MALAPFMVSASAAGAVLLARTLLRRRVRSVVLLFSEARLYEMFDVVRKAATAAGRAVLHQGDGNYVEVTLNWNNAISLRVPALLLDNGQLDVMEVFEVYSGLLRHRHPDGLLLSDAWNLLMAIVSHHLRRQLQKDNAVILDDAQAEGLLALCTLLRGKYAITRSPLLLKSLLLVHDFPEKHFQLFLSAYNKKKSTRLGLFSFSRLVYSSCSFRQLIVLTSALMLSPDAILNALAGWHTEMNWTPLYVTEIGKTLSTGLVPHECSFFEFLEAQFSGAPGALVAIAVTSIGPVELLYCLRNVATNYILMELVAAFHVSAYLALATADYCPDNNWSLSQSVSHALWHVSSSAMGELQSHVPLLLELLSSGWVAVRFPVMALAMWLGVQWSDFVAFLNESLYLESQYAKRHFLSPEGCANRDDADSHSCKEGDGGERHRGRLCCAGNHRSPSPICLLTKLDDFAWDNLTAVGRRRQTDAQPQPAARAGMRQHHGLAILLLVSLECRAITEPSWNCILRHVSWPLAPTALVRHIAYSLAETPQSKVQAVNLQRLQWVKEAMRQALSMKEPGPELHCGSRYRAEYFKGFTLFRQNGLELGIAKAVVGADSGLRNDKREDFIRDALRGVFRTADAMPLLLTSTATLCSSQAYLEQTVLEQNSIMSHLDFIKHAVPFFPPLADMFYEEHGLSEAQIDLERVRRRLMLGGSSLGCYQVLEELQFVQHGIDRPVASPPPSMEGPWSVEFHDVSYRYSECHPYILRGVSFSVAKGSFLGIAGYSGAGKTTLLRLLNRTYAPTSGEIRINGIDIRRYPVRMLRRRIVNAWQEEMQLRLFDQLSIADNVALGNLWACSEADIHRALSTAQALSFVQKRSSSIHAPLRAREFSGGEVERLCIARALMRQNAGACLYVFDEATSAVDTNTERLIFRSLGLTTEARRLRHTTSIVVSHRLATLKSADTILVLNDGRVEQLGCWDELCRSKPDSCFSRMMRSQQLPAFDP
ncbi:putative ABC transporter [Trypanosoma conorhini]|uniref:Putative ABC transporter n=1 Tax=Trypanosoma conorhini TaxID=83891 RepID=A0A3S5ISS5_9TRYP|nr:putative ABC transporter [Trypanosoma conorhini]RNF13094.1 putative ABC transporter [Trypanosoma conorhini]